MTGKLWQHHDTPEFCLIQKYMRVNRCHRKAMEQMLDCTGVPGSQHQILMFIAENPNASQKELAQMRGISTATVAVSLKKLEQGGYIKREMDSRDNRYNQICITEKGTKVIRESVAIFDQMEQDMFRGFSGEDFKVMGELLDRIYDNLKVRLERNHETGKEGC